MTWKDHGGNPLIYDEAILCFSDAGCFSAGKDGGHAEGISFLSLLHIMPGFGIGDAGAVNPVPAEFNKNKYADHHQARNRQDTV